MHTAVCPVSQSALGLALDCLLPLVLSISALAAGSCNSVVKVPHCAEVFVIIQVPSGQVSHCLLTPTPLSLRAVMAKGYPPEHLLIAL